MITLTILTTRKDSRVADIGIHIAVTIRGVPTLPLLTKMQIISVIWLELAAGSLNSYNSRSNPNVNPNDVNDAQSLLNIMQIEVLDYGSLLLSVICTSVLLGRTVTPGIELTTVPSAIRSPATSPAKFSSNSKPESR